MILKNKTKKEYYKLDTLAEVEIIRALAEVVEE